MQEVDLGVAPERPQVRSDGRPEDDVSGSDLDEHWCQGGPSNIGVFANVGIGGANLRPDPRLERPCRGELRITFAPDCGLLATLKKRSSAALHAEKRVAGHARAEKDKP